MTVYVDELQRYDHGPKCLRGGSCHMMADTLEELHAMADAIGMKRTWFQPLSSPHYDLTASRRAKAIALGAVFKPAKEQAIERLAKREGITVAEWHARKPRIP